MCLSIGLEGSVLRSKRFKGPYSCQPTSSNFKFSETPLVLAEIIMKLCGCQGLLSLYFIRFEFNLIKKLLLGDEIHITFTHVSFFPFIISQYGR